MSAAKILEHFGGGYYKVMTDQGSERHAQKLAKAERDLEQANLQIEKINQEITNESLAVWSLKLDLDNAIAHYQVTTADPEATEEDFKAAQDALRKANDTYRKQKVRIDYLEDIGGKWALTAVDAQERIDQCNLYPPNKVRYMWSADGYEGHQEGDIVRVLDLFIEGKLDQGDIQYESVIAPRSDAELQWHDPHKKPRAYLENVDGYRLDQHLMTPAAWAVNVVLMPAVQQRVPRYRAGVVIGKDVCGLEVEHFKIYSSGSLKDLVSADPYGNNPVVRKYNARYGARGIGAFQVGDKVVVKIYDDYDDERNLVIGFLEKPREPWAARVVAPTYETQGEDPGTYTKQTKYGRVLSTVNNYAQLIREGRQVDVVWNGPNPDGSSSNDWRQSERFWQFPTTWDQTTFGQQLDGPPESAFCWTSGAGSGINGLDTFHFFFFEYGRLLPYSGVEDTIEYNLAQIGELGLENCFYMGSDAYTGFPGDPGQTRWQNRPIQCAIYVDGMLSETLAIIQATTFFPRNFYDRVPGPNALMAWYEWPNDPSVCRVFTPRDFSAYNDGFAYWDAYSGVRQTQEDYELAIANIAGAYPYEGPNQIEDRVPGYTMKTPPLLCDIWPILPPPNSIDTVYPDPWDTRQTYTATLGGLGGP